MIEQYNRPLSYKVPKYDASMVGSSCSNWHMLQLRRQHALRPKIPHLLHPHLGSVHRLHHWWVVFVVERCSLGWALSAYKSFEPSYNHRDACTHTDTDTLQAQITYVLKNVLGLGTLMPNNLLYPNTYTFTYKYVIVCVRVRKWVRACACVYLLSTIHYQGWSYPD